MEISNGGGTWQCDSLNIQVLQEQLGWSCRQNINHYAGPSSLALPLCKAFAIRRYMTAVCKLAALKTTAISILPRQRNT